MDKFFVFFFSETSQKGRKRFSSLVTNETVHESEDRKKFNYYRIAQSKSKENESEREGGEFLEKNSKTWTFRRETKFITTHTHTPLLKR